MENSTQFFDPCNWLLGLWRIKSQEPGNRTERKKKKKKEKLKDKDRILSMHPLFLVILCFLPLLSCQLTDSEKTSLLQQHNTARQGTVPSAANMVEMVWDDSLANTAQAYAELCPSAHSNSTYRQNAGENLAWGWPSRSVDSVMGGWVGSEKPSYNLTTNTCSQGGVCGHYTQVVWASSFRLGCGKKSCSSFSIAPQYGRGDVFVCMYGPAGNFAGQRPYVAGAQCSSCPSTFPSCHSGLCTNA